MIDIEHIGISKARSFRWPDPNSDATDSPRKRVVPCSSALTCLITDDALDEDLIARTIHDVLMIGLRPR